MTHWLHAEYRDFHGLPRAMICTSHRGTFLFLSRFDQTRDRYTDHYEVHRLPRLSESEVCASWFGLETRAIERLPDLPVHAFPFDVKRRKFLEYDRIAPLLSGSRRREAARPGHRRTRA